MRPQKENADIVSQQLLPWTHYRVDSCGKPKARKWYELHKCLPSCSMRLPFTLKNLLFLHKHQAVITVISKIEEIRIKPGMVPKDKEPINTGKHLHTT